MQSPSCERFPPDRPGPTRPVTRRSRRTRSEHNTHRRPSTAWRARYPNRLGYGIYSDVPSPPRRARVYVARRGVHCRVLDRRAANFLVTCRGFRRIERIASGGNDAAGGATASGGARGASPSAGGRLGAGGASGGGAASSSGGRTNSGTGGASSGGVARIDAGADAAEPRTMFLLFGPYKGPGMAIDWNTNVVSTNVSGNSTPLSGSLTVNGGNAVTLAFQTGECGSELGRRCR